MAAGGKKNRIVGRADEGWGGVGLGWVDGVGLSLGFILGTNCSINISPTLLFPNNCV